MGFLTKLKFWRKKHKETDLKKRAAELEKKNEELENKLQEKDRELEQLVAILRGRKCEREDLSAASDSDIDANQHTVQVHVEEIRERKLSLEETEDFESTLQEDNPKKQPGNKTNDEKEELNWKIRTLKQFLCFKDRVIHKEKEVIKQMKEERKRNQESAEQMKLNIATLERLLGERGLHNRTPDVLINERQESNVFIERNMGKCDLLRKVQHMGEEIRRFKEGRTLPTGCDSENDEKNEIRTHAVNSFVRLETIYEVDQPPESDSENDEQTGISDYSLDTILEDEEELSRIRRFPCIILY